MRRLALVAALLALAREHSRSRAAVAGTPARSRPVPAAVELRARLLVLDFGPGRESARRPERTARPAPQAIEPAPEGEPHGRPQRSQPARPRSRARLKSALAPRDGAVRAHRARRRGPPGRLSASGSTESDRPGHLLVVQGNADIYGQLLGNLVTVDGDVVVHPGGVVSGDILDAGRRGARQGGEIGGEVRTLPVHHRRSVAPLRPQPPAPSALANVFRPDWPGVVGRVPHARRARLRAGDVRAAESRSGVRHRLAFLRPRLRRPACWARSCCSRPSACWWSGLILSVAGILLLPFAVVVYALLVVVGAVGGFLAVAHAMGETYTRRRLALGAMIGSPNSYRYLLVGLGALAALWLAWAVFGWVPVAGDADPGRGLPRDLAARHGRLRRGAAEPGGDPGELRRPAAFRPRRSPTSTSGPRRSSACPPRAGPAARGRPRGGSDAPRALSRRLRSCSGAASAAAQSDAPVHHLPAAPRRDPAATRGWSTRAGGAAARAGPRQRALPDGRHPTTRTATCPSATYDAARGAWRSGSSRRARAACGSSPRSQLRQTATVAFSPARRPRPRARPGGGATPTSSWAVSGSTALTLEAGASRAMVRFSQPNARALPRGASSAAGAAELSVLGLGNSRCDRIAFEGGMGKVTLDFGGAWTSSTAGRRSRWRWAS